MQFRRITQSVPVIIPGWKVRVVRAADVKIVEVGVAVGVGAQPDKAVSRGVLRDGHVEQLHLVHLAGHVAFLQQTNKQNEGGEMWVTEKREACRFLFPWSMQRVKCRL